MVSLCGFNLWWRVVILIEGSLSRVKPSGFLIAFDQDLEAIKYAKEKFKRF